MLVTTTEWHPNRWPVCASRSLLFGQRYSEALYRLQVLHEVYLTNVSTLQIQPWLLLKTSCLNFATPLIGIGQNNFSVNQVPDTWSSCGRTRNHSGQSTNCARTKQLKIEPSKIELQFWMPWSRNTNVFAHHMEDWFELDPLARN